MEVRTHPIITINNHTFEGEMSGYDISQAICASFKDRPKYCNWETFYNLLGQDSEYVDADEEDSTSIIQIILAIVVFALCNIGMILIHRRGGQKKQKTEIQMEVN